MPRLWKQPITPQTLADIHGDQQGRLPCVSRLTLAVLAPQGSA